MSTGWICVHRQLLEWEWFSDHNTFRLFVYFMLKANHQDKRWKGILIKRGQHLTSLDGICVGSGLTKSQVRTSIKKLKSTHEIAHESNKQHTVITVINYNLYQSNDTQVSTRIAHESHTNDTRVTTNNNDNNEKKKDNIHQQIADSWNEVFKDDLPSVSKVTQKRKSAINGCIAEMKGTGNDFSILQTWTDLFVYAKSSDFLMGRKTDWSMSFDFITTKSKLIKLVEGEYDNG